MATKEAEPFVDTSFGVMVRPLEDLPLIFGEQLLKLQELIPVPRFSSIRTDLVNQQVTHFRGAEQRELKTSWKPITSGRRERIVSAICSFRT